MLLMPARENPCLSEILVDETVGKKSRAHPTSHWNDIRIC
jgi:hypothetical protein